MRIRCLPVLLAFGAVLPLASGTARADAIDGTWCSADGRTLTIEGPSLITPGGTRMTGDYRRHAFFYVVPSAEPYAGSEVAMTLVNEETVHLALGLPDAEVETWTRCDFTS